MATPFALLDAHFVLNSVDLSTWVTKVTLTGQAVELVDTAMGATSVSRIAGLKDYTVAVDFNQDFGASAVDATLWPLWATVTTFSVKATSAANSATNPQYSGSLLIAQYKPIDGAVGALAQVSLTWNSGGATLARATS